MASESERIIYPWPCAFNDFSKLSRTVGECTDSSEFSIGSYKFCVRIYPHGDCEGNEGYVTIFLQLHEPPKTNVKCSLSILLDTRKYLHKSGNLDFDLTKGKNGFGWKFVEYTTLAHEVLAITNDQLVILAELYNLDLSLSPYQSRKFFSYEKYLNNEDLSDVKIIASGQTIHAHKIILTSENEVFKAMFKHDLKESRENVIKIEDFEFDVMIELLRFVYVGQVRNIERVSKKLLIAADKYGVNELKLQCEIYLSQLLSINNVLDYLNFANQYRADRLRTEAITFFMTHRKSVAEIPGFQSAIKMMDTDLVTDLMTKLCHL